eukprot:m.342515 g.342515  ORF g.342515 m.342515 type:complete len:62 (+) comp21471_c0_seq1:68-253(+)
MLSISRYHSQKEVQKLKTRINYDFKLKKDYSGQQISICFDSQVILNQNLLFSLCGVWNSIC